MFDNPRGAFTSDAININRNYVNEIDEDGRRVTWNVEDYILSKNTWDILNKYDLCNDQWPENRHIPPQL